MEAIFTAVNLNAHEKISSNLYRELVAVKTKYSSIRTIQDNIVAEARAYTDKTEYFDILTEIQHYGGKTNLIDFTTDYNVALFFACYGSPAECGRVIILKESDELKKIRHEPQIPEVRVRSQKSVFIEPPNGYIEVKYEVILYFSRPETTHIAIPTKRAQRRNISQNHLQRHPWIY